MHTKPTEGAEMEFQMAYSNALLAMSAFRSSNQAAFADLALSIKHLAGGLQDPAIGQRATYNLLGQVQAQLAQPKTPGRP